jgi:hypothetical protein
MGVIILVLGLADDLSRMLTESQYRRRSIFCIGLELKAFYLEHSGEGP